MNDDVSTLRLLKTNLDSLRLLVTDLSAMEQGLMLVSGQTPGAVSRSDGSSNAAAQAQQHTHP